MRAAIIPAKSIVFAKIGAALLLGRIRQLPCEACIDNNMMAFVPAQGHLASFFRYLLGQIRFDLIANPGTVPSLNERQISELRLPIPPLPEQRAIAAFLDRETEKIDALVHEQRRLIALMREKRQAIISHAVTKGLDPTAPMKPSGVDWLGDIPAHWGIQRFSRAVSIAEGQVDPRTEPYRSMVLIAPNHIEQGTGRLLTLEIAEEQGADSGKYEFEAGAVLYSKIRPGLAKVVIAPCAGLCSADMYPLRGRGGMLEEYLANVMLSPGFTAWATLASDRVAMPKINREKLNELNVPLPPPEEQQAIVAHIKSATDGADRLLGQSEHSIDLLQERRAALISAAVTGKIDVRGTAPDLTEAA